MTPLKAPLDEPAFESYPKAPINLSIVLPQDAILIVILLRDPVLEADCSWMSYEKLNICLQYTQLKVSYLTVSYN